MALNPAEWLKLNTSYCKRLRAWITARACDTNRQKSALGVGDLRCSGCNGLDDQVQTPDILALSLQRAMEEAVDSEVALEEAEEGQGNDHLSFPSYMDGDFYEEALQLFPGMQELIEEDDQGQVLSSGSKIDEISNRSRVNRHNTQGSRKKYAVFIGRCTRCKGYMVNDIERYDSKKDDDIYRCFTCGWRTSPEYAWNRAN